MADHQWRTQKFRKRGAHFYKNQNVTKKNVQPIFSKVCSTYALTFIKVTGYTVLSYLPFINHNRIEYNNITKRTLSRKKEYHNKKHNITNRRVS